MGVVVVTVLGLLAHLTCLLCFQNRVPKLGPGVTFSLPASVSQSWSSGHPSQNVSLYKTSDLVGFDELCYVFV